MKMVRNIPGSYHRIIYNDGNVAMEKFPEAVHVWVFYHRLQKWRWLNIWQYIFEKDKFYERDSRTSKPTGVTANTVKDIAEIIKRRYAYV